MDVGTRTLRYFIAVAEELSFTRAAERLFVSQPAVSRQIRQLENDLDIALFARDSRDVSLTSAGTALLASARKLVSDWESAQREVRAIAAHQARTIRVGFVATGAGPLTTKARAVFVERYPGITVEPRRFDWGGEADALRQGLVDVAFVWLPADLTGLQAEVVAQEHRMVGMAVGHRLADQSSVVLADLRGEPMPRARHAPKEWVNWWGVVPRPDGSEPVWGPANDNVEELLEQVAVGPGICIVSASMAEYYVRPDIVWLPLLDAEPLRIAVCWAQTNTNSAVVQFVLVVRELAELVKENRNPRDLSRTNHRRTATSSSAVC